MKTSFDKNQDLRVLKTKRAIIEAFGDLIFEKSFKDITISEICEKALVNRSTFYLHFDDKEQLLMQSIYDVMFRINEVTVSKCRTNDIGEYYRVIGDLVFKILTEHKSDFRKLFKHNDVNLIFEPAQSYLSFNINRHIKTIKKTGSGLDLPSSLISEFYSGGIISLAKWWIFTDYYVSPDKLEELIFIILRSFLAVTDYSECIDSEKPNENE